MHKHGILHRDIKPSNVVFGNFKAVNQNEKDGLYFIDYGLSTKYIDNDNNHYKYLKNRKFVGSIKYASVHALNAEKQSRSNDLESLFYVLIYLLRGNLPWNYIASKYTQMEKYEKTRDYIFNMDYLEGLPNVFKFIYKNIKLLDFDEETPYFHFVT